MLHSLRARELVCRANFNLFFKHALPFISFIANLSRQFMLQSASQRLNIAVAVRVRGAVLDSLRSRCDHRQPTNKLLATHDQDNTTRQQAESRRENVGRRHVHQVHRFCVQSAVRGECAHD